MGKTPQSVTDTELAVLRVLWQSEPTSARAIAEQIYAKCDEIEVATVRSMLQRLEAKKLVHRDRKLHVHLFTATKSPDELCGEQVDKLADKFGCSSLVSLVTHMVKSQRVDPKEIQEIRELLDQYQSPDQTNESP